MTADNEIPTEPLTVSHTSTGFLPDIALHQRGEKWHHESSYSHFWFFGIMCVLGLVVCFIPWDARTFFNFPVRYFVAAGFLWGGICGLLPFYIRNRIGQHIVVDTTAETVTIDQRDTSNVLSAAFTDPTAILTADPPAQPTRTISFSDVLGIQITGSGPYQANIVYRDGEAIARHNLVNHGAKSFPKSIANAYCLAGGFQLIDHT